MAEDSLVGRLGRAWRILREGGEALCCAVARTVSPTRGTRDHSALQDAFLGRHAGRRRRGRDRADF